MERCRVIDQLAIRKFGNILAELARYSVVGGVAFVADFGSLYVFTDLLGVYYLLSAALAFFLGLIVNYRLSVCWVFETRSVGSQRKEFVIFLTIGLVGLALNELFMWWATGMMGLHYMRSKAVSTGFVYLWNFFARKYILFNEG